MELDIKGNGKMTNSTGEALKFGPMAQSTKESMKTARSMDRARCIFLMAVGIKASL